MGRAIEMAGVEFEGCVVLGREGTNKDKKATWRCRCKCGLEFVTAGTSIRSGLTKSCGCYKTKVITEAGRRNKTHGESKTRLYNIWHGMKKRCYTKTDTSYKYYGARGISVCKEWANSYKNFRDWALGNGYEEELTLDRIDSKGDYHPGNCRWSDWVTQGRNRTNNIRVEYKGRTMTLSEVAEAVGISRELLWYRHHNGIRYDAPVRYSDSSRQH